MLNKKVVKVAIVTLLMFAFVLGFQDKSFANTLSDRVDFWNSWAPYCEGYPSKQECDDGDMTLFSGLLCASGEQRGCDAVRLAQATDGGWYRSPRLVGGRGENRTSFSRDMSMGVMLYLAKTKDQVAAKRWLDWINSNRPCVLENPINEGCLQYGFHRYCRDERNQSCTLTPASWGLMDKVWRYIGLTPSDEMAFFRGSDENISILEAMFNEGYERHLKGVYTLILQLTGESPDTQRQLSSVLSSAQPINPFFRYLNDGNTPLVNDLVLDLCPSPSQGEPSRKTQWAWERDESERAWENSMGWDCIFMVKLLE